MIEDQSSWDFLHLLSAFLRSCRLLRRTPVSQGAGGEDLAGLEERGHRRLIAGESEERKASLALFSERAENESGWGRAFRMVEVKDEEGLECKLCREEEYKGV
ncbi:hypothetical protein SRHO_G00251050 [Serrasalmus rhombeus]